MTAVGSLPRACVRRLQSEFVKLATERSSHIHSAPDPTTLLELHFVIIGPDDSPYEGGHYHGKLRFTGEFPFKPPAVLMLTPNGRFETNTRLCLSISGKIWLVCGRGRVCRISVQHVPYLKYLHSRGRRSPSPFQFGQTSIPRHGCLRGRSLAC